jgi:GT2 family glycosyltransferase
VNAAIDVIIVNHNTREDLERCLGSLASARTGCVARVIVIDNASTDGSVDAVRAGWPGVEVVPLPRNAGFGAANNVGLRLATAPLVLLLNSDTLVPAGAIEALATRRAATGAVAAGPRLVDAGGRPEVSFGPMLSPVGEARQWWRQRTARADTVRARAALRRLTDQEQTVDWVTGACLLADRQAVVEAGLFDERYFMYEEDVDLCAALRHRGGRILFTPAATITHLRGRSARAAPAATRRHYDHSHVAFYEKHHPHWAPLLRLWVRLRGRPVR